MYEDTTWWTDVNSGADPVLLAPVSSTLCDSVFQHFRLFPKQKFMEKSESSGFKSGFIRHEFPSSCSVHLDISGLLPLDPNLFIKGITFIFWCLVNI